MTILAGVVFGFWVIVLAQTIVNLWVVPRLSSSAIPTTEPLVSIVIPARNESRTIERTVRAFLAQDYPNLEVIVVDDRSSDETGDVIRGIGDARVTVIDGVETPAGWLGKPWALDQGGRRARGELILAVDADVIYAPSAIREGVAALLVRGVSMIVFLPHFEMVGFADNVAMPMLAFTAFSILPLWLANRVRAPQLGGGAGTGNLIRREMLERIGFFAGVKHEVVDDVKFGWRVREAGGTTLWLRADRVVSVRMYHGGAEIVEGFTKNMFAAMSRSYLAVALTVLIVALAHLWPYVMAFRGSTLALATVAVITLVRLLLFRSLRYRLDSALFLHPLMMLVWTYIFLRSAWFTGIRGQVRWRGRTYTS